MMSELFPLSEAEPKSMPRKSNPERDPKKAKIKEAESLSKGLLSKASKEIQKAIESLHEEAVTKAVKSYCASLEEEKKENERLRAEKEDPLKTRLQELNAKHEKHHRLTVLSAYKIRR